MLTEGVYSAKLIGAGLGEDKEGNAQPWMKFEIQNGESKEYLTYFGSFKTDKNTEYTVKAFTTAGFTGDVPDLQKGNVLDYFKPEGELTVTIELYNEKPRIKWVNVKKSRAFSGDVKQIKNIFSIKRAELGVKNAPPQLNTNEALPF